MAEPLLDQICEWIRTRAGELEPAVREAEQLAAALAALDGLGVTVVAPARSDLAAADTTSAGRRRTAPTARRSRPKRAPRGANHAAVLGVLADRPGASASELSAASGVAKPVLYALLKTLGERGEIAKEQLPGGTAGYRLTPGAPDGGSGRGRRRPTPPDQATSMATGRRRSPALPIGQPELPAALG